MDSNILRRFSRSILFILFSCYADENEFVDLGSFVGSRSMQYEIKSYDKIFVYSPYRTGSTYIFNVLRFLFEDEETKNSPDWGNENQGRVVCKYHSLNKLSNNVSCFVTIRNPFHSFFSFYRIYLNSNKVESFSDGDLRALVDSYMETWYQIESVISGKSNAIILRYEMFLDGIDFVFMCIESFYSIEIKDEDKLTIRKSLSLENVIANARKYNSFDEFDLGSLIHGNHIQQNSMNKSEFNREKRLIFDQLKKHQEIICKLGYSYIFDGRGLIEDF